MSKYSIQDATSLATEPAVAYSALESGFRKLAKVDFDDKFKYLTIIRGGLKSDVLFDFMKIASLHIDEMAHLLHLNSRTLRRVEDGAILDVDISEKLVELIRLYKLGHEVFGDVAVFNTWMKREIKGIDGHRPINIVDTSVGVEIVRDELMRLSYGVFS